MAKTKRPVSEETRAKISAAMKGKRNAASKPCACRGKNPDCACKGTGLLGHVMTQQGIEAIRKAQAKRRRRERAAAKQAEARA